MRSCFFGDLDEQPDCLVEWDFLNAQCSLSDETVGPSRLSNLEKRADRWNLPAAPAAGTRLRSSTSSHQHSPDMNEMRVSYFVKKKYDIDKSFAITWYVTGGTGVESLDVGGEPFPNAGGEELSL